MIAFAGSVPENYHRNLGAVLFQPYASDLAGRIERAERVLEIACGTGILTQAIADRFPSAEIVATDLNPGMIEIAKQHVRSNATTWRQADATQLPFPDREFDTVVCQFGFMFVPEKVRRLSRSAARAAARRYFSVQRLGFARGERRQPHRGRCCQSDDEKGSAAIHPDAVLDARLGRSSSSCVRAISSESR